MTFGFALLTAGTLLLISAIQNQSIVDVLQGKLGKGPLSPGEELTTEQLSNSPALKGMVPELPHGKNPAAVALGLAEATKISGTPYEWGGGHVKCGVPGPNGGYDCSGAVSAVLGAMGMLKSPLVSGALASWGEPGPGTFVTVYANPDHTFMKIAGLWFGTGYLGNTGGPAFGNHDDTHAYTARHPKGF